MGHSLGVDLGTTYSAAAVHEPGTATTQVVALGYATTIVPSAVLVTPEGETLVGEAALRRGTAMPDRLAREFKRRIGDSVPVLLGGSPFSAEALTGRLLAWVVRAVVEQQGGPPDHLAVTHPANWGPFKQDRLQQAIRLADLGDDLGHDVPIRTLTEPEAAAISYAATERVGVGEVVAVYDLGGGTFDGAVLRKAEVGFEVLGTPEGIERLGGIDVDEAVFRHVAGALDGAVDGLPPDDPVAMRAVARLRQECVEAKEALSSDTDTSIPVVLPALQTEVRLTRSELEAMVRPVLDDTVRALRRAITSADLAPADVDRVLLVGGTSRMPLVAEMVTDALHRPVHVDAHPKHAVALGAAIAAAGLPATRPDEPSPPARPAAAAGMPTTAATAAAGTAAAGTAGAGSPAAAAAATTMADAGAPGTPSSGAVGDPTSVPREADRSSGGAPGASAPAPSGGEAGAATPGARSPGDAATTPSPGPASDGQVTTDGSGDGGGAYDLDGPTVELGPRRDPLASPTLERPDLPWSASAPADVAPGAPAAGPLPPRPGAPASPPTDVRAAPTGPPPPSPPPPSGPPLAGTDAVPPGASPGSPSEAVGAGPTPDPGPGEGAGAPAHGGLGVGLSPDAGAGPTADRWSDAPSGAGPALRRSAARPGQRVVVGSAGVLVAAVVLTVAVMVVVAVVVLGGGDGGDGGSREGPSDTTESDAPSSPGPPSPPELRVGEPTPVAAFPDGLAVVGDRLVVASTTGGAVATVDVATGAVDRTVPLAGEPLAVLHAEGSVWVTQRAASTVARIDPSTGEVLATIDAPGRPVDLAQGAGSVWAVGSDGVVTRIDPATNRAEVVAEGIAQLSAVVASGDRVWLTHGTDQVGLLDPETGQVTPDWAVAGENTDEAVLTGTGLWVLGRGDGTVSRLDPDTGEELARVPVGTEPAGIVADEADPDRLWVIDNTEGTLVLVHGPTGEVLARVDVGRDPLAVATTPGTVWVSLSGADAVVPVAVSG